MALEGGGVVLEGGGVALEGGGVALQGGGVALEGGGWVHSLYCAASGLQFEGLASEEVSAEPETAHGILVWRLGE